MNICLLKCGNVQPDLLHISGDYEDMFISLFSKYTPDIKFHVYDITKNNYPSALNQFDGFISTGSPYSVYDQKDWIKVYNDFTVKLFDLNLKHVGICFGHQMIAQALGGKVQRSGRGWGIGIKTVQIYSRPHWMNGEIPENYRLIASHRDQVTALPENATVIAGNDHCPVGMFTIGDHVLGIQQHPEFTKEYHIASINSRKKVIEPGLIEIAMQSLEQDTDCGIVTTWIENFFKSRK